MESEHPKTDQYEAVRAVVKPPYMQRLNKQVWLIILSRYVAINSEC